MFLSLVYFTSYGEAPWHHRGSLREVWQARKALESMFFFGQLHVLSIQPCDKRHLYTTLILLGFTFCRHMA